MQENHISTFLKRYSNDIDCMAKHPNELLGLPTGMQCLDRCLTGLRKGNLILVAGRPCMGKESLATNISLSIARYFQQNNNASDEFVLYFSMFASGVTLVQKFISCISGIPILELCKPPKNSDTQTKINEAISTLSTLPLYFNFDTYSVKDVRLSIEKFNKSKKVGFIVIDFLQCLGLGKVKNYDHILKQLRNIAQEFNIPVLVLSLLKRDVECRDDKRPRFADLCSMIKTPAIADVIMFLYNEFFYLHVSKPIRLDGESKNAFLKRLKEWEDECKIYKNKCTIDVSRNINGSRAALLVNYNEETARFSDDIDE